MSDISNMNELKGDWYKIKGAIKQKWGEFTDDEITTIDGKKEKLVGSLMKKYGMDKEDAKKEATKVWDKYSKSEH